MDKNFYNPSTGEKYYISRYRSLVRGGKLIYVDNRFKELTKDGVVLLPIEVKGDVEAPGIRTATKNRV